MVLRLFIFLLSVFFLVSCDEHEAVDLDIHPGHILCDDGSVLSESDFFVGSHKIPVAVIFTERLSGEEHPDRYLGVLLKELPYMQFSDTLGLILGTSTDVGALSGDLNTVAMQNSHIDKAGHGSPLADYVFAHHEYGQSDFIPSAGEFRLLYSQREKVNAVLRRLNAFYPGIADPLFTDSRSDSCWYWTSTEVAANASRQSWLFSMSYGTIHETPKTEYHAARAIVSFYPFTD